MMQSVEFLDVLQKLHAVITNTHVVYTSGKHGSAYVNKDALYPHTAETSRLCRALSELFHSDSVEVVIAPAVGGVILSQWTAYHLSEMSGSQVLGVYADKLESGDAFVIKRGYDALIKGKNVLVVEDVLTTGGSVRKVIEATRACGGNVIGCGVICNRGGVTAKDLGDVPKLVALVNVTLDMWDAQNCHLCELNVPINLEVGKGQEFLARKTSYVRNEE